MEQDYADMSTDELKAALKVARERLRDVEETFNFTLTNTNTHLADAMVLEFEQDLYDHRDLVKLLSNLLKEREGSD